MASRKKLTLEDTVELMNSEDYKDRFRAEYWQLRVRCEKLEKMITKFYDGKLDFELSTPIEIHVAQLNAMNGYLKILELRAQLEKIKL